jgi:uncharacterized membrane protein YbaN (DUF454 family)
MDEPRPVSGPLRLVLLALGWVLVGLAALGIFVPVLPTTPLLILAAACFVRSSPRLYRWILDSRLFGPLIRHWRATRTIPVKAKATAITLIVIVGGISVVFSLTNPWTRVLLGITLLTLIVWILRLPTVVPSVPVGSEDAATPSSADGEAPRP